MPRIPTKRRMVHSFQFSKQEDESRLIKEISEMKIDRLRALFQLIEIQNKAKEIANREFKYE